MIKAAYLPARQQEPSGIVDLPIRTTTYTDRVELIDSFDRPLQTATQAGIELAESLLRKPNQLDLMKVMDVYCG